MSMTYEERAELVRNINKLNKLTNELRKRYWETHKRIVEELPCADLDGAKTFAEVYGFKYQVNNKFYKNASDINYNASHKNSYINNKLSEEDVAIAHKVSGGYILRIVRVIEIA